ncbi:MAG: hypothetical protein WDO70_10500 [Alphaproteobacteria bacterium]
MTEVTFRNAAKQFLATPQPRAGDIAALDKAMHRMPGGDIEYLEKTGKSIVDKLLVAATGSLASLPPTDRQTNAVALIGYIFQKTPKVILQIPDMRAKFDEALKVQVAPRRTVVKALRFIEGAGQTYRFAMESPQPSRPEATAQTEKPADKNLG